MSNVMTCEIPLNEIKQYILANVELQRQDLATARLLMQGAPGSGKSDIMRQICEENGWVLSVKYLSNMSLEQVTGIPCRVESGETASWTRPELFTFNNPEYAPEAYLQAEKEYAAAKTPEEKAAADETKNKFTKVLLIDDFHLADRIMQKYLFQVLTYKSLNGYSLPPNTAILLAGNRSTDKALANPVPAPIMNRMSVFQVTTTPEDWLENFAFKNNVRGDICSFIHRRGEFLAQEPIESAAWASPRSWTFLSRQMDVFEKMFGSLEINKLKELANGLIGPECTSEFIAYRELFAKWDFDQLSKMTIENLIPMFEDEASNNPTSVYAIVTSAVNWMIQTFRNENMVVTDKVKFAINYTYEVLSNMAVMKSKNNVAIKPLVIAGTKYINLFQKSMQNTIKDHNTLREMDKLLELFMLNMEKKRDTDWVFYGILSEIWEIPYDDGDEEEIAAAEQRISKRR